MLQQLMHLAAEDKDTGFNPFDSITPSFGPFNDLLTQKVGVFLALAWAIGFAFTAYHLIEALARLAKSRKGYSDNLDEAKSDLLKAAASTVGLAALPVIFAVLIST